MGIVFMVRHGNDRFDIPPLSREKQFDNFVGVE
jgi:hypothetical protein